MGVQNERQPQTYRARPEPGQLVEVRRRQWVVADVDAAGLETGTLQHCVTLSSIDEDGLGEELEVVWEIEPGAQVIERAGLPSVTGQDDSGMLDAFLDEMRKAVPASVAFEEVDTHINTPAFAAKALEVFDRWVAEGIIEKGRIA